MATAEKINLRAAFLNCLLNNLDTLECAMQRFDTIFPSLPEVIISDQAQGMSYDGRFIWANPSYVRNAVAMFCGTDVFCAKALVTGMLAHEMAHHALADVQPSAVSTPPKMQCGVQESQASNEREARANAFARGVLQSQGLPTEPFDRFYPWAKQQFACKA
jgi:hypothetical protein